MTDQINVLNIALMLLSALLAFAWPFYLFLIAYAVLGPLHYLTEISWLHDRNYYTGRKHDAWLLIAVGVIFGATTLAGVALRSAMPNLIIAAFLSSIVLAETRGWAPRIALLIMVILFVWLVPFSMSTVISGLLLLTIVHVFVFTGCFILFGSVKSASRTGYLSFVVFLGLAWLLLAYRPMPGAGVADEFVLTHYTGGFGDLNVLLLRFFHLSPAGNLASDPFEFSSGAVAVMRFIAFAYLYHYLNWFSKTKIIRWHEVSRLRLASVGGIWLLAIAGYLIDYNLGIKLLFTLSALHVLLEFPLDVKTIGGLATTSFQQVKSGILALKPAG